MNSALLCERCGYTIERIPHAALCPECGGPIAESLHTARTGSPFQRQPSLTTWWTTNWRVLCHSATLFRHLRVEPRSGTRLLLANLVIAGIFVIDPWVGVFIGDPSRHFRNSSQAVELAVQAATWLVEVGAGVLVLFALTRLEWFGVRFFANRRGWRLTPEAAWQVCCHASVGWIFVGLIPLFGMAWLYIFANFFGLSPRGMLNFPPLFARPVPWANVINFGVIGLGFFAGMLVFETLVYLGVRQCRYANPPQSLEPPPPPTPTLVEPAR